MTGSHHMQIKALTPRKAVPSLNVSVLGGSQFDSAFQDAEKFTLVVFYRGLHCPICIKYLIELEELVPAFNSRGVQVLAISSDSAERAAQMAEKIKANHLKIGYGLNLATAREWGLYISTSRGKTSLGIEEPALFSEPGVYIIRADGNLYYGSTQTMPFARPSFKDLLGAIDFAIAKDYPARGEYMGEL
jgi:peroxiredoxin